MTSPLLQEMGELERRNQALQDRCDELEAKLQGQGDVRRGRWVRSGYTLNTGPGLGLGTGGSVGETVGTYVYGNL